MIRLYIGPSASGKDRFLNQDVKSGRFRRIVSCTTRPRRKEAGEVDGVDYFFYSSIDQMLEGARPFEYRRYETKDENGNDAVWYYGSCRQDHFDFFDYVGVVDMNGVLNYIKEYGTEYLDVVFVKADASVREDRAKMRGDFNKLEWDRRLADDAVVFSDEELLKLKKLLGSRFRVLVNNKND